MASIGKRESGLAEFQKYVYNELQNFSVKFFSVHSTA
jgi:hypothetical protein